ncbi:MAG: hypothetical protein EXS51_03830 [Candidatus Taylorbacteria bacterium]|nr:hypothetical protein [Candidatus Taylorbacteria bacterium]
MKNSPSLLVSGLGMGMQLLQKLTDAVVQKGGYPEMLYSLCTSHESADITISDIADLIAKADWRIPRSLLERLVVECYGQPDGDLECNKVWHWATHINFEGKFGIAVTKFSGDRSWCDAPPAPPKLIQQFVGRQLIRSMQVVWEDEPHVIVDGSSFGEIGQVIRNNIFEGAYIFAIAPAKRFDFDR